MDEKGFSTTAAIEKINSEITKIKNEMQELNKARESLDQSRTGIIVSYEKKAALLEKLEERKQQYLEMSGSFKRDDGSISLRDRRINYVNEDINKLSSEINGLNARSKNPFVRMPVKAKEAKLARLKKKKGRIEKRQRKITNLKVSIGLIKLKYQSSKEGRREGLAQAVLDHKEDIEKNLERVDEIKNSDAGIIRKTTQRIENRMNIIKSYTKYGIASARCFALQKKDGLVAGAIRLPKNIADKLKNFAAQLNIQDQGGRHRA